MHPSLRWGYERNSSVGWNLERRAIQSALTNQQHNRLFDWIPGAARNDVARTVNVRHSGDRRNPERRALSLWTPAYAGVTCEIPAKAGIQNDGRSNQCLTLRFYWIPGVARNDVVRPFNVRYSGNHRNPERRALSLWTPACAEVTYEIPAKAGIQSDWQVDP